VQRSELFQVQNLRRSSTNVCQEEHQKSSKEEEGSSPFGDLSQFESSGRIAQQRAGILQGVAEVEKPLRGFRVRKYQEE
jgi:hypothetical protein